MMSSIRFSMVLCLVGLVVGAPDDNTSREEALREASRILNNATALADPKEQTRLWQLLGGYGLGEVLGHQRASYLELDDKGRCQEQQARLGQLLQTIQRMQRLNHGNFGIDLWMHSYHEYRWTADNFCARIYEQKMIALVEQVDESSRRALDIHISFLKDYNGQPMRLSQVSCDFDAATDALDGVFRATSQDPTHLRAIYYPVEVTKVIQECDHLNSVLGDVIDKRIKYSRENEGRELIRWALRYKFCQIVTNNKESFSTLIDQKWTMIDGGDKLLEIFSYLPYTLDAYDDSVLKSVSYNMSAIYDAPTRDDYIRAFEKLVKSSPKSKKLCFTTKKSLTAEAGRLERACRMAANTFRGHLWLQSVGYDAYSMAKMTDKHQMILTLAQLCKTMAPIELTSELRQRFESAKCL